jgi:hypothetical protein
MLYFDTTDIVIQSPASCDVVAETQRLVDATAFRLANAEPLDGDHWRLTFDTRRPDMAVGFGNLIELQIRIARGFEIVSVERRGALVPA